MKKYWLTGQSTHYKLLPDLSTPEVKTRPVYGVKCALQIILFGISGARNYVMEKPFISVPHSEMGRVFVKFLMKSRCTL